MESKLEVLAEVGDKESTTKRAFPRYIQVTDRAGWVYSVQITPLQDKKTPQVNVDELAQNISEDIGKM